jgi:hypothetical protein
LHQRLISSKALAPLKANMSRKVGVLTFLALVILNVATADLVPALPDEGWVADDTCTGNEAECGLSLRQLRGEKQFAEDQVRDEQVEELDPQDQDTAGDMEDGEDPLFSDADVNTDGEIQHQEMLSLLARISSERSEEEASRLFGAQDVNGNAGLDTAEFASAMESWGTTCSSVHKSWFCSGGSKIKCCKKGLGWTQCGTVYHDSSCWHGLGAGGSTTCKSVHKSWFCQGNTKITCCKNSWGWKECGHVNHWSGCR